MRVQYCLSNLQNALTIHFDHMLNRERQPFSTYFIDCIISFALLVLIPLYPSSDSLSLFISFTHCINWKFTQSALCTLGNKMEEKNACKFSIWIQATVMKSIVFNWNIWNGQQDTSTSKTYRYEAVCERVDKAILITCIWSNLFMLCIRMIYISIKMEIICLAIYICALAVSVFDSISLWHARCKIAHKRIFALLMLAKIVHFSLWVGVQCLRIQAISTWSVSVCVLSSHHIASYQSTFQVQQHRSDIYGFLWVFSRESLAFYMHNWCLFVQTDWEHLSCYASVKLWICSRIQRKISFCLLCISSTIARALSLHSISSTFQIHSFTLQALNRFAHCAQVDFSYDLLLIAWRLDFHKVC